MTVYSCIFAINNKAVEGSGSEGAPKYAGEGVTYRVFLGVLITFFAYMRMLPDVPHQLVCTIGYVVTT